MILNGEAPAIWEVVPTVLWDRCNYTASVEYGYALPVSRRLNLDFSIGVGYLGGRYIKYEPQGDNYVCRATRTAQLGGAGRARLHWCGCSEGITTIVNDVLGKNVVILLSADSGIFANFARHI